MRLLRRLYNKLTRRIELEEADGPGIKIVINGKDLTPKCQICGNKATLIKNFDGKRAKYARCDLHR